MNVKIEELQDLVLMAARAPDRVNPGHHLLGRLALRLLETREANYVPEALAATLCPGCLRPLERCPECNNADVPPEFWEPYCGYCDTHWISGS